MNHRNGPGVGILAIEVAGIYRKPNVYADPMMNVRTMWPCPTCGNGIFDTCLACEVAKHWRQNPPEYVPEPVPEHPIECFCIDCLG